MWLKYNIYGAITVIFITSHLTFILFELFLLQPVFKMVILEILQIRFLFTFSAYNNWKFTELDFHFLYIHIHLYTGFTVFVYCMIVSYWTLNGRCCAWFSYYQFDWGLELACGYLNHMFIVYYKTQKTPLNVISYWIYVSYWYVKDVYFCHICWKNCLCFQFCSVDIVCVSVVNSYIFVNDLYIL